MIVDFETIITLVKKVSKIEKTIASMRFDKLCYETGLEDATYTADTKDIFTGSTDILDFTSYIGLAMSEVISLDKLNAYNITVRTVDNSGNTSVIENKTYRLSDLESQPISACGYKFYVPSDIKKYIPEAVILVISDYDLFNERYPGVELTSNGVYLAKNEWDSSKTNENGVWVNYTNYSEVVSIESLSIKTLDNIYLDLLGNEDFNKFKKNVERNLQELEKEVANETIITTGTSTDYEATVPSITELKAGVSFLMKPHITSTTGIATLNVNGFGAKEILRYTTDRLGFVRPKAHFLSTSKIYRIFYDGQYWILSDYVKPVATDLQGIVPVENGGVPTTNTGNTGKILTTNDEGIPEWQTPPALSFDGAYDENTNKVATVQTVINKIAEIVANAPEDFDTLKEMSDWITSHSNSASQMNSNISSNTNRISTLEGSVGDIETALDNIISIQNSYLGGTS